MYNRKGSIGMFNDNIKFIDIRFVSCKTLLVQILKLIAKILLIFFSWIDLHIFNYKKIGVLFYKQPSILLKIINLLTSSIIIIKNYV